MDEAGFQRKLEEKEAELVRAKTELATAKEKEGSLDEASRRLRNLVFGVAAIVLLLCIGVAVLVALVLDVSAVQDDFAADKVEEERQLDERRFNACVDARQQALADNEQRVAQVHTEEASIVGFQADIDLVGPLLEGASNPDTIALGQTYLAAKDAVIASKRSNIATLLESMEDVRVCTEAGIEAFGQGRPEAFEPPTIPAPS